MITNPTYLSYMTLAACAVAVLSLISSLSLLIAHSSLKRKFKKWKSIHATADLDGVYERTVDEVNSVRQDLDTANQKLEALNGALKRKISTAQVMRYNAFAETGSDLSFSVALLDDEKNGVVVSSIYGREESRTYAKPIANGASKYPLTDEEMSVVEGSTTVASHKRPVHV